MSNKALGKALVVYQTKSGALALHADATQETFWLTQEQVAKVFNVQKAAVSKHVKNIFDSGELLKKATVSKMETVQIEGGRKIKRQIAYYNLDLILSIGYRVNSKQATRFRQWATKTLRQYIVDGYAINRTRIKKNYHQFTAAMDEIKRLLPSDTSIDAESVLDLIRLFADTWVSLEAYDTDTLVRKGVTKKHVAFTAEKLVNELTLLKKALVMKGETTNLFGVERFSGNVSGIIGSIMQTFDGKELYESVEEKAAHLLYFMVKNHPMVDGNKRSGAYAFVWFLRRAGILDTTRMTPAALTALTILVAESDPKDKEKMIRLILTLLAKS